MGNFLSVYWDVNPEIVAIGPMHLRYYGILMVGGFFAAYMLVRHMFRREQLSQRLFDSFAISVVVSTLIGMRLGHCLFYQPEMFIESPLEVFLPVRFSPRFEFIGYQGLASHGGAIGILLGVWWWCHKHKRHYMWAIERVIIAVPLVGALIRLGNLMNSEIYGTTTDLPWGFIFALRHEITPHHPTQLYEALSYAIIFLIMWGLYTRRFTKMKRGMAFGLFLILLFGIRFAIEFIKQPQVDFEASMALNMGQLLSLPFIVAGIILLWWSRKYGKPAMDTGAPAQSAGTKTQSAGRKVKNKRSKNKR
ncbi:MAG: prolipoprotein diacylglyceryl transferase [Prevotellaceae bacterium]|jgi:prolipoprotein diacylglyceryl transferase|nr:prolipoprotein diacylglyceryl transferase [Prevotellaceae bacterium]